MDRANKNLRNARCGGTPRPPARASGRLGRARCRNSFGFQLPCQEKHARPCACSRLGFLQAARPVERTRSRPYSGRPIDQAHGWQMSACRRLNVVGASRSPASPGGTIGTARARAARAGFRCHRFESKCYQRYSWELSPTPSCSGNVTRSMSSPSRRNRCGF